MIGILLFSQGTLNTTFTMVTVPTSVRCCISEPLCSALAPLWRRLELLTELNCRLIHFLRKPLLPLPSCFSTLSHVKGHYIFIYLYWGGGSGKEVDLDASEGYQVRIRSPRVRIQVILQIFVFPNPVGL